MERIRARSSACPISPSARGRKFAGSAAGLIAGNGMVASIIWLGGLSARNVTVASPRSEAGSRRGLIARNLTVASAGSGAGSAPA